MPRDYYDRDDRRRYRDDDRDDRRDRGFVDRMEDEVRSWFGDDAERRRRRDRQEQPYRQGYDRDDDRGAGRDYDRDDYRGYTREGYGRGYDRDDDRGYGRDYGARSGERGYERTHARSGYGQDYYDPYDYRRKYTSEGDDDDYRGYGREDWMTEGEHTGRGPKGYRRSDERISEEVCERLERHGQVDASDIEVRVENGEVTLAGTVANRRMKRLAEDAAESIYGVRDVHNHLRVQEGSAVTVAGKTDEGVTRS